MMTTCRGFQKPSYYSSGANRRDGDSVTNDSSTAIVNQYPHERRILPICAHRTQILHALETHGVLILVGETGCGKSTQLPQYLYENGWADDTIGNGDEKREIICTQPRRIAAMTLAERVSKEIIDDTPNLIGYSVRFANTAIPGVTKIRYVTDGWLLREATLVDPLLQSCSVLIIDEAHERSLNTELLLGVIKKIRKVRPELRVIVCSATLEAESFLNFFIGNTKSRKRRQEEGEKEDMNNMNKRKKSRWGRVVKDDDNINDLTTTKKDLTAGTIISVDGRQHPVDIMYVKDPVSDYVKSIVEVALRILDECTSGDNCDDGDILCFLATGEEIDSAVKMAEDALSSSAGSRRKRGRDAVCLPLYSSLPARIQSQVFLSKSTDEIRNRKRRIIFTTNIAEASVTVPNIAHVVDCGYAKMPFFDPLSGFDRLIVCPISKASAQQRAGRAGRVRSGRCYRLYSENDYNTVMEANTAPEIQRCDLTNLIMTIKALGVSNVLSFDLMSIPTVEALSHGLECLYALGALNEQGELTKLGQEMVYFPTDPRTSRMLLAAMDMERRDDTPSMIARLIVGDVLTVAASLQVRDLFLQPRTERQFRSYDDAMSDILDRSGDHVTAVNLLDLVDHSGKMLSEEECRSRFVNRDSLRRSLDIREQLARFLSRRFGSGGGGSTTTRWLGTKRREIVGSRTYDFDERSIAIRKCVCAGYFMNVARLGTGGRYYSLRGNYALSISPASVLHRYGESSEYIVYGHTYDGSRGGVEARPCSSMSGLWLKQLASHYWT
jgi:ATP-dependent RNA helicase DDX35